MSNSIKIFLIIIIAGAIAAVAFMGNGKEADKAPAIIEVTDSTGAEVKIPQHPKKVVFLNVSNMDMYYAAGGTAAAKPTSQSVDKELQAKTADVPEIGTIHSPNIEKILELNPDLVVGVNVPFHTNVRETLSQAGIPLYINKLDTYDDVLHTLDFFAELTGKKDMAAAEKAKIQKSYETAVSKARGKTPPKSLIIFGTPGSFNMATSKSFSGDLVKQLGGGNIADLDSRIEGGFVPLSMEFVTKENPEVILFISMSPNPELAEAFKKEMKDSSLWQGVKAVQNNRIYFLSGSLFSLNPGTKIGQSLEILYKDLYEPEAAN